MALRSISFSRMLLVLDAAARALLIAIFSQREGASIGRDAGPFKTYGR